MREARAGISITRASCRRASATVPSDDPESQTSSSTLAVAAAARSPPQASPRTLDPRSASGSRRLPTGCMNGHPAAGEPRSRRRHVGALLLCRAWSAPLRQRRGDSASGWRLPPRASSALLAIVVVVGLAWALLVPPWQSPDEVAHFALRAEPGRELHPARDQRAPAASPAIRRLPTTRSGASRGAFYPQPSPPDWSRADCASVPRSSRATGLRARTAPGRIRLARTPALLPVRPRSLIWSTTAEPPFGRLYAVRIWGVLLLAATALGAWLLAGRRSAAAG